MRLLDDWKDILRRAWSVRLFAIVAALPVLDVTAQIVLPEFPIPPMAKAAILVALGLGGVYARIIMQRDLSGTPEAGR